MQYRIINYKKEKFYVSNKKELFDILDGFKLYDIKNYFTDEDFRFSNEGGFTVESETLSVKNKYSDRYFFETYRKTVNAIYMIFTEKNVKVDLEELISEYKQSRGLLQKKRPKSYYNRGTKFYSRHWKSYYKTYDNSFTKEYRDNISALEEGVKIRSSRANEVKLKHIFCYEDDLDYRKSKKSWKDYKKNKKQWMKNESKQ